MVLLLVLGILALLSLLAVSFVFQSRLDLRAAENFENTVSADEVAEAAAAHAQRLLDVDKRRRSRGVDLQPDSGDEEGYDSLIDLWRAGTGATMRLEYTSTSCPPSVGNESNLGAGDLLQVINPATGAVKAVGLVLGVDTTPVDGACPPANDTVEGIITLFTENPAAWAEADLLRGPGTVNTAFGAPVDITAVPPTTTHISTTAISTPGAPIQVASNDLDLNGDASLQVANTVDDDNDGVTDEADEGLDAIWQNYYDQQGRLVGRFAVLIEDESAKANVNVIHNLSRDGPTADLDPGSAALTNPGAGDQTFSQNAGVSTFEINAAEALDLGLAPAAVTDADKLVFYRHGLVTGDNATGFVYLPAGSEANRIYVPGQGRSESAGYSNRTNDDDNANRLFLGSDGIDNDGDGNPALSCAADPNCDEADEGVNEPQEFTPLAPIRRQPQVPAAAAFEADGVDNDVEGIIDESNEGDDLPLLALEDLTNPQQVALDAAWLSSPVRYADATNNLTVRRNLVSIESQDRNLDSSENPRVNVNFASGDEMAAAAVRPFFRALPAFREVEFRALQAAVNLYDYRDSNMVRDEVYDASGNVFAGVESVRINEIMVAPGTRMYEAEGEALGVNGGDATPGVRTAGQWNMASDPVALPLPGAAGSPRANPNFLASDPAVLAAHLSATITVNLPTGTAGPPGFLDPAAATDNDGDALLNEDAPVNNDPADIGIAAGLADEDPAADGINEDAEGGDGEDPITRNLLTDSGGGDDGLTNEDGSAAGVADVTARFIVRCRTNANLGFALNTPNADRGFMLFVNGEAIWPAGALGTRWGVPAQLGAAGSVADGQWFVQQGLCRVVPGANTVQFFKPTALGPAPVDRIDLDWFYITFEPDAEWIELVNLSPTGVDVGDWTIQTDAVVDTNLTDATTPQPYSVSVTIPAGTTLPPGKASAPSYTVFAVDAFGAGTVPSDGSGVTTTGNFNLLDQEGNDPNSPDTMAYDKLWPTATSAAPQSTNQEAVQLDQVGNLFVPQPRPAGFAADGIDNDGDGNPALTCAADPFCDEPDEEADDFVPFTELFPNEPINDLNNDTGVLNVRGTATAARVVDGIDNDEDTLVDEADELAVVDSVWTGIDVATVSLFDADGGLVDRVTYDAADVTWGTDITLPAVRGFGAVQRRSPLAAGDRLQVNRAATVAGSAVRVDNFVIGKYDSSVPWAVSRVPTLADGNYDDWTPRLADPAPTPGRLNRTALALAPVEPSGRGKDAALATVGELGRVPFDDGHPYDPTGLDTLRLDDDVAATVTGATALTTLGTALTLSAADAVVAARIAALVNGGVEPVFLRDHTGDRREHMRVTAAAGLVLTLVRGELGLPETHAVGAVYDVLVGNPAFRRVATIGYASALDPAAGDILTNTTQGNTRTVLRVDAGANLLVVFDPNGTNPWEVGDSIQDAVPVFTGTVTSIHTPESPDVDTLCDVYTTEALVLEATQATVTTTPNGWRNSAPAGGPLEFTLDDLGDRNSTVDLVWDAADGVEPGIYHLYVYGQAGARLTIEILDANNTPISALTRGGPPQSDPAAPDVGLPASADDIVSYGALELTTARLAVRITNAGTTLGSGVTQNRVTRAVLAPPRRTLGRVNLNTASDRLLRGLPNLQRPGGGAGTIAARILQDRRVNGPFTGLGTLMSSRRGLHDAAGGATTVLEDSTNNDGDQVTNRTAIAVTNTTVALVAAQAAEIIPGATLNDAAAPELLAVTTVDLLGDAVAATSTTALVATVSTTLTLTSTTGIYIGSLIQDDDPALPELLRVQAVNRTTNVVTFTAAATQNHPIGNTYSVVGQLTFTPAAGLVHAIGSTFDVLDEPTEAEDVFSAIANLTTVRSDLYKIIAVGQAAVDANADGIIQSDEVRAEKKVEFLYER